jgi:hypothetical protein
MGMEEATGRQNFEGDGDVDYIFYTNNMKAVLQQSSVM